MTKFSVYVYPILVAKYYVVAESYKEAIDAVTGNTISIRCPDGAEWIEDTQQYDAFMVADDDGDEVEHWYGPDGEKPLKWEEDNAK